MSDLIPVGRVGRAHGLDGSFVVEDASADESRFAEGATLVIGGEPVRVVSARRAGGRPAIRLDRHVERGAELCVPRAELSPAAEGAYYVFELVGLEVEEEGGRRLGRIADVSPGVANDVLELDSGLALPMHEACVRAVDLDGGTIVVARGFADPG